ncbi:helix-turn-helix domain-containing protein [Pedobacter segetis]|uniref:helix-turn-helix domain-containing protein n=1 Tax=Pedobacter segetis TaxID=2793069 RepID=UPI0037427A61
MKALTNQTTIGIIRNVRIKRAAQLLETKHYNVSEVAYMVGFTDLDYFRKCFKEKLKKNLKIIVRLAETINPLILNQKVNHKHTSFILAQAETPCFAMRHFNDRRNPMLLAIH